MLDQLFSLLSLAAIALASYGLGRPILRGLGAPEEDRLSAGVWSVAVGLIAAGMLLAGLGLAGLLHSWLIGVLSVTGTPEIPSKVGISIADIAAGMYAYTGILTGLFQRERTGQGTAFDVSMFEALGEWMGFPAYFTAYGGEAPPRSGAHHATIVPYGPFAAADGKTVLTDGLAEVVSAGGG